MIVAKDIYNFLFKFPKKINYKKNAIYFYSMNLTSEIKPILFFGILIALMLSIYYHYEKIKQVIPLSYLFNGIIVLIGLGWLFFPDILSKIKKGKGITEIQKYIRRKYKRDN